MMDDRLFIGWRSARWRFLHSPPSAPLALITAVKGRVGRLLRLTTIGILRKKNASAEYVTAGPGIGASPFRRRRASVKCDQVWIGMIAVPGA